MITPVGWVAIGVTAIGVGLYYTVPGAREAVTTGMYEAGEAVSNGLFAHFTRKKDLGFIDHLLDKYGIRDKKVRERIHRQISGQHYTDEEIEDIVAGESELTKKPEKKDAKK